MPYPASDNFVEPGGWEYGPNEKVGQFRTSSMPDSGSPIL